MEKFDEFIADETAAASNLPVVNVAISLILVATLGVAAWQLLGNANYTGVDATTKTIVQTVVGIVAAIAVILAMLKYAK